MVPFLIVTCQRKMGKARVQIAKLSANCNMYIPLAERNHYFDYFNGRGTGETSRGVKARLTEGH